MTPEVRGLVIEKHFGLVTECELSLNRDLFYKSDDSAMTHNTCKPSFDF